MRIEGLNVQNLVPQLLENRQQEDRVGTSFDAILSAYMGMMNETNRLENDALNWQLDFATGRTDDIQAVMLAQEAAFVALNFSVQVTNRIIETYREIMRVAM